MRPKLVFTGPTLSQAEALQIVDAICLPPAVQGSIVAAVQRFDPGSILVIDGGFQSEPAVRHKEILWALSRGGARRRRGQHGGASRRRTVSAHARRRPHLPMVPPVCLCAR